MSGRVAVVAPGVAANVAALAADLAVLGRYRPCPHDGPDLRIGSGKIWARCHDCGAMFQQASAPQYQQAAAAFDTAHERIDLRFATAAATVEALRTLLLTAEIDDGATGCIDTAARALAAFDAAMR